MSVAFHFSAPELLTESHQNLLGEFDCGIDELNRWLTEKALGNQFRGVSRTYVTLSVQGDVAGFYSLSNFALSHQYLSARYKRNMPNPIPCCLLGRLAVAQKYGVMSIPTFISFKNGEVAGKQVGAVPKSKLQELIR